MTASELDSFYFKFKNLVFAEKNATLTLNSEGGRTRATLSVDLGHLLSEAVPQQPHHSRNGPARRRRRERRAAARRQAEAVEASESAEQVAESSDISEQAIVDEQNKTIEEDTTQVPTTVTEEVTDEFCTNEEYNEESKDDETPNETVIYELECWDPDDKWIVQDVYNHMGETLEQMFRVFEVKAEDQQYQLDVVDKVNENFQLKLEMKNFENNENVIENFRRQGHVPGGGCVKFFRKYL